MDYFVINLLVLPLSFPLIHLLPFAIICYKAWKAKKGTRAFVVFKTTLILILVWSAYCLLELLLWFVVVLASAGDNSHENAGPACGALLFLLTAAMIPAWVGMGLILITSLVFSLKKGIRTKEAIIQT